MIYTMAGKGVSVLATTHYMDEAEFCNVIGMMYRSRLIALNDPDSLKNNMQGFLFEVDCTAPGKAELLLKSLPQVQDVAAHGVLLHVLLSNENDQDLVHRILTENQIQVARMERILPSLEDVFVSLVDQENRQHLRAGIE
jgi:ABC-2 type transport system ATP-binding protein